MYKVLVFFAAILLTACSSSTKKQLVAPDFIDQQADYALKINNLTAFLGELRNNDFLKNSTLGKTDRLLEDFEFLNNSTPLYYIQKDTASVILFKKTATTTIDSTSKQEIDFTKIEEGITKSISIQTQNWFAAKYGDIFLFSNTNSYLQQLLKTPKENTEIKKLLSVTNKNASANLLFKETHKNSLLALFQINDKSKDNSWKVFDLKSNIKELLLSGIVSNSDEDKSEILKNATPLVSQIANVCAEDFSTLKSYTFSEITTFNTTQKFDSIFASSVQEIGFIKKDTTQVAVIFSTLPENTLEYCVSENITSYRDISIYRVTDSQNILAFFKLFEKDFSPKLVAQVNDALLFTEDETSMEHHLNQILNGKTLQNDGNFVKAMNRLPEASSMLTVTNLDDFKTQKNISEKYSYTIQQAVVDDYFTHLNLLALENDAPKYLDEIGELNSIKLENEILTTPKLVTNYVTKELEVVVQDKSNQLYLLSLDGAILWKKQLDSPILGEVSQVDIHGNGRLQFAFTTAHNFYIVTRDGKDISNFPIHFNDKISNPTGIFDYDLNHNYRFLITQNKQLFMVDKSGKSVNGFKLNKTLGNIITTPKHIRVGRKDYIVFETDDERLHIVNRVGKTRVTVNQTIAFSGNDIYWHDNHFVTTNTDGNLVMISEAGNVSETPLPLVSDHKIKATAQTLVTLSENNLSIKDHKIAMDFGIYTDPKIYYLHQKIYVALTDKQTNRLFVFDSNGAIINGFPVFAKGMADMNINTKTEAVYLTAQSGNKEIVIYKLPPLF